MIIENITCSSRECWPYHKRKKKVQQEKNRGQKSGQEQEGNTGQEDHYKQWHGGKEYLKREKKCLPVASEQ